MITRKETVFLLRNIQMNYESVSLSDLSRSYTGEYICLGTGLAEFEIASDDEQIKAAISTLEIAKQKERADSQIRLNKLDAQIQSLLAIECRPEQAP